MYMDNSLLGFISCYDYEKMYNLVNKGEGNVFWLVIMIDQDYICLILNSILFCERQFF